MHATTEEVFFIKKNKAQRYVVTFIVSACLIFLLLSLPLKIYIQQKQEHVIALKLSKVQTIVKKTESKEIVPKPKAIVKQKIIAIQKKVQKPKIQAVNQPKLKIVQSKFQKTKLKEITQKQHTLPTAVTLLNSIKSRKKMVKLTKEFQAKTGQEEDFVYKSVEQAEIFKEFKLINEETDKPKYKMNFYAEGIEGSVERFMDKITYKKRFTTKYGTKIDCAAVALVMVTCGWK